MRSLWPLATTTLLGAFLGACSSTNAPSSLVVVASDAGPTGEPPAGETPPLESDAGTERDSGQVPDASATGGVHPDGAARLRIVASNLSTGVQTYEEPGMRILRSLEVDVALVQEMNHGANADTDLRAFVDEAFGTSYGYVRGPGNIPNGVVSRYPIVQSGSWVDSNVSDRTFVWARIDIPGPTDLFAVSVHLLSSNPASRAQQASAIVTNVKATAPAGAYVTVGGDFNTSTRNEACLTTFSEVFGTSGPYPTDTSGGLNTNAPRSKPYDWVLGNGALDAIKTPVKIASHTLPAGLVFDTREYTPREELPPALASDSAADGMQHMAVVRDFLLPETL